MKFFRLHISRLTGVLLLTLGMVMHFAKPVEENTSHDAFTSWLSTHLKTQNHTVLDEIEALSTDSEELESVIRKASELVLSNTDDFELPISTNNESSSEEDLYHLLLTEWNIYQKSSSGMGKAVFIQNIKPQTILPTDTQFFSSAIAKNELHYDVDHNTNCGTVELTSATAYILSPLKSGTAIGAP